MGLTRKRITVGVSFGDRQASRVSPEKRETEREREREREREKEPLFCLRRRRSLRVVKKYPSSRKQSDEQSELIA